eukprot:TRINITY_DN15142_c0_g1_i1.p1 TRINITY_DN15142_c0_g1~~TRINITY_DN15142_c0_g1_i1.p1  ORF type:complete len:171 (+),score=11.65 TRINITY_DN15142_c0_g1_i1:96-608(+)
MVSHAEPFWWRIVVSEETAFVQVTEVLLVAPVIHVILRSVQHSVLRWTESRPWLPQVIANGNRRLQGMGVPPTDAAALRLWADFWAVALSHSLGLLLCLPAVTGGWGLPPSVPAILGRHSAILECAWELGDITLGFIAGSGCRTVVWNSRLPCSGSSSSTTPWVWALLSP